MKGQLYTGYIDAWPDGWYKPVDTKYLLVHVEKGQARFFHKLRLQFVGEPYTVFANYYEYLHE